MKEIFGDAKSIRNLLSGSKFAINYYQREYRWETKQMMELIADLADKFLEDHKPGNERSAAEQYGHYVLGSIIISDRGGQKFIINGQQRLNSITLLLIHLHHQLKDDEQKRQLADLIFSQRFGKRSFNLDVPERTPCMDALFTHEPFDDIGQPESVANILARFNDIGEGVPDNLDDAALPYFADWVIENVHVVEIAAYSDTDAYTIFETMNDRGLSLTSTDMLKGYLLTNITDTDRRNQASHIWRERITVLQQFGKEEKKGDADAIKAWLRSQHAQTTREHKRNAEPGDFDLIGTEFHRWVRDHEEPLKLKESTDFGRFIREDFDFYSRWYECIRQAAETLNPGLETIYYNAQNKFTLQYPALLAPLRRTDSANEIHCKLRIVAGYLDILIARHIWNSRATDYSTMQYAMFQLILEIRGKPLATMSTSSGAAETATRSSISGPTIPNGTPTSSRTPPISSSTATGSADSCSCPRASTPATETSLTRRSASTILARTCSPRACMRPPTSTTRAFGGSARTRAWASSPTQSSRKWTWMRVKCSTARSPS